MSPRRKSTAKSTVAAVTKTASNRLPPSSLDQLRVSPRRNVKKTPVAMTKERAQSRRPTARNSTQVHVSPPEASLPCSRRSKTVARTTRSSSEGQADRGNSPLGRPNEKRGDKPSFCPPTDNETTASEVNKALPMPTIIGKSGLYQIFKLRATLMGNESSQPRGGIKLGLTLETKEWVGTKLRKSFDKCTAYTFVKMVKGGSIAERAGALKGDILVWSNGPEPVVFHQLVGGGQSAASQWKLIDQAQFEGMLPADRLQEEGLFNFYVARPMTDEVNDESSSVPASSPSLRLSANGITLSPSIAAEAINFRSFSAQAKLNLLQQAEEDSKKHFEADRDAILASLPNEVKSNFSQIGFAHWGQKTPKTYQPVLILSPFSVPPGPVRNLWLQKYEERKRKRSLSKMNLLVYWYGETDPMVRYSFLPQGKFSSFSKGEEIKCAHLPAAIQKKLDSKHGKLTIAQQSRVRAQREMEADLAKKPEQRAKGRIPAFQELYESISESDLVQLATENRSASSYAGGKRPGNETIIFDDERPLKRRATPNDYQKNTPSSPSKTNGVSQQGVVYTTDRRAPHHQPLTQPVQTVHNQREQSNLATSRSATFFLPPSAEHPRPTHKLVSSAEPSQRLSGRRTPATIPPLAGIASDKFRSYEDLPINQMHDLMEKFGPEDHEERKKFRSHKDLPINQMLDLLEQFGPEDHEERKNKGPTKLVQDDSVRCTFRRWFPRFFEYFLYDPKTDKWVPRLGEEQEKKRRAMLRIKSFVLLKAIQDNDIESPPVRAASRRPAVPSTGNSDVSPEESTTDGEAYGDCTSKTSSQAGRGSASTGQLETASEEEDGGDDGERKPSALPSRNVTRKCNSAEEQICAVERASEQEEVTTDGKLVITDRDSGGTPSAASAGSIVCTPDSSSSSFAPFLNHARKAHRLQQENRALRGKHLYLKERLKVLEERHRKKVEDLQMLCGLEDCCDSNSSSSSSSSSNNNAASEPETSTRAIAPSEQYEHLLPPSENADDANYFLEFSGYLRNLVLQNGRLDEANRELDRKRESQCVRHAQLIEEVKTKIRELS